MKNSRMIPVFIVSLAFLLIACSDDTDDRNKFIGRYEVKEQSLETHVHSDEYEVRIIKDTATENMVIITNFYNLDIEASARIDGNTITVTQQTYNLFEFFGSGTLSGSIIVLDYTVTSSEEDSEYFDRLRAEMTLVE